ncbi:ATP-binding protein [Bacillus pinisoli]|uniref:ATP-binding protein n=1 Tax=Bacillus pinisoli TaxID=2901866 RepID=UPI001FF69683|nr:ATP-binding protein [Bacillus pinisoli]
MCTFELELPCQLRSIELFDTKATEYLQKYTDSHRSLAFIAHELLINSLEASFRRYGDLAFRYSIKLKISQYEQGIDITVSDYAGGIHPDELHQVQGRSLEDIVSSEDGRGLLMIEHMVDDIKMEYKNDGAFEIKVRKEGVHCYDQ